MVTFETTANCNDRGGFGPENQHGPNMAQTASLPAAVLPHLNRYCNHDFLENLTVANESLSTKPCTEDERMQLGITFKLWRAVIPVKFVWILDVLDGAQKYSHTDARRLLKLLQR